MRYLKGVMACDGAGSFGRKEVLQMRTLALINAKGGVGKTTSALVMADILHREHGKRVLVIDLDPQLNTSKQMGVYEAGGLCVAHLLVDKTVDVRQVIKASPVYDGVDVIPCDKA